MESSIALSTMTVSQCLCDSMMSHIEIYATFVPDNWTGNQLVPMCSMIRRGLINDLSALKRRYHLPR